MSEKGIEELDIRNATFEYHRLFQSGKQLFKVKATQKNVNYVILLTDKENRVYVAHECRILRNEANKRLVASSLSVDEKNNADTIDDTSNIHSVELGTSKNLQSSIKSSTLLDNIRWVSLVWIFLVKIRNYPDVKMQMSY